MKKSLIIIALLMAGCEPANNGRPLLVSEQDGVKLYKIQPCAMCEVVYFITPCGDVSYDTQVYTGKVIINKKHQVNGTGCK